MKILYILEKFPLKVQTFILNEMIGLIQLGHTIIIAANSQEKGRVHKEIKNYPLLKNTIYPSNKPNFTGYKNGTQKALDFFQKFPLDLIKSPLKTAKITYKIVKISSDIWSLLDSYLIVRKAQDLKIDLIHTPFASLSHLETTMLLSEILHVPFTLTFRAFDLYDEKKIKKKLKILKKASGIMTISRYNKENIIKKFKITNISLVHSAINPEKFQPSKSKKRKKIITVCRFSELKGIKYLIESCKILQDKGIDFEFTLVGYGPLKEAYEILIKEYGLQKKVTIKELLIQEEVKKELDNSMVFVLPCLIAKDGNRDILANVLKEAMAMQIPVITSNICGIEELIEDGKTGILVPPKDSEAIADAIIKLLKNKPLRAKMGNAGREKIIKDFNFKKEVKKLERVFLRAIEKNRI